MRLTIAHRSRPRHGESVCGDAPVLRREGELTLFGVIDALGHGPGAATVAARALDFLGRVSLSGGVRAIFDGLGGALKGTRGAAATLCLASEGRLVGAGVGNVELRCTSAALSVALSPGILGTAVRRLVLFDGAPPAGARILVFSDGISRRIDITATRALPPEAACREILERAGHPHDDATILVADVEG